MAKFEDLDLLRVGDTIQIVGAIWAGEGQMHLCMFPDEHGRVLDGQGSTLGWEDAEDNETTGFRTSDGEVLCAEALNMTLDEWQQFIRQTDIMEASVLTEGPDGKVIKSIVRKSARQISQHVSWAVYRRDGYRCRYCGRDDVPLTVDHLVLWEEGGPSTEANLVASCKRCNKTRGNTQYTDWLNHPYYQRVSKNLTATVRQDNLDLVATLDGIPRMLHKPSKRK